MKKLLFVVNGHSGKGQIKNKLLDIIDIMIKEGYHVQVHTTQEREDATKVVREQAKYYDLVVCSGGDGTLDEAVTGMMQSEVRTPLGYIPAGSTNDFANSLEIPKDMIQAAKTAVLGVPFSCMWESSTETTLSMLQLLGFLRMYLMHQPGVEKCTRSCGIYLRRSKKTLYN